MNHIRQLLPLLVLAMACRAPATYNAADRGSDEFLETAVLRCILTDCLFQPLPTWTRTLNVSPQNDAPEGITVDADYVYIAGSDETPGASNPQFRLEKRDILTGDLVSSFGTAGVVSENLTAQEEIYTAVAVDGTSIFTAGYDRVPGDFRWRVDKRDINSGALDVTFGTAGSAQFDSPNGDQPRSVVLNDTGVFVGGRDAGPGPGDRQWRLEKRDIASGDLNAAFNSGNALQENFSASNDNIRSIVVDGDDLFIGGSDRAPGNERWRMEKRNALTGALDTAFGTSGVITLNHSASNDQIESVVVDGDAIFAGGHDGVPGNDQWRIMKFNRISGATDTTFGVAGAVTFNHGSGSDQIFAMAIWRDRLYVLGTDSSSGTARLQIRVYFTATGALDTGFNAGGFLTYAPGSGAVTPATQMVVTDGNIYLAMADDTPGNNQWIVESRLRTTGGF